MCLKGEQDMQAVDIFGSNKSVSKGSFSRIAGMQYYQLVRATHDWARFCLPSWKPHFCGHSKIHVVYKIKGLFFLSHLLECVVLSLK